MDNVESSYYRYIFLLRTTHRRHQRTYYLAAEGENQLKSWIEYLRSALNLREDKNFFNKVQLGLQLSTRNSVLGHTNQNGVRFSRIQNPKEASESLEAQTRIDFDGSTEKLGLANRNYKPESQITMEVGSLPDALSSSSSSDCFRFFIAGGSTFYSIADLGKVNKSRADLAPSGLKSTVPMIETVNGTEESNFSSNESIEYEMPSAADAAKQSSTNSHSRINSTAIFDKCRPPESSHPFPDARNSSESISAKRLSAMAAVDTILNENVADFQGSASPKLHYYEYSLEEMEMIIFDDSQQLEDFEGEEETKNGIGAGSNESNNRIFFSLARTKDEKRENKGRLQRSRE